MKLLVFLWVLGMSCASLQADFSRYMTQFDQHYTGQEQRLRGDLFRRTEQLVKAHNSVADRTWDMALNQFSVMTDSEKSQHLGLLNETESRDDPAHTLTFPTEDLLLGTPTAVDNVALGFVTRPKDQRTCGSCWAFAGVAAFEGAYSRATNVLKSFSEKEALDCTYSEDRNGCKGGWYQDLWSYIRRHQRLASLAVAPYDYAKDRECKYGGGHGVPNGIKNARYVDYVTVPRNDRDLEKASARAVVAVAMIVEDDFYSYGSGIYAGCSTHTHVGHAVTLVGYDQQSWKVKNSWGRNWGEGGYVRFSRSKSNNCRLADFAKFPVVQKVDLGEVDTADPTSQRKRAPGHGCAWGDDYPCSEMNCNYGCKSGTCWSQCNGICGIVGSERCATGCLEWCWMHNSCSKHEDCFSERYWGCNSACSL